MQESIPAHPCERLRFGSEQQPLLIIDNLMPETPSLIEFALQQNDVSYASGLYPGLRSPAPPLYASMLRRFISPWLDWFDLTEQDLGRVDSYFSMVATPAEQLNPFQQVPHFDRPDRRQLAVIHYLCNEKFGGTSFYRHRSTGYEFVDNERADGYFNRLQSEIDSGKIARPPAYINESTELFEKIMSVDCRFNRAIVYRCSSLHSGNIGSDFAFDLNPLSGRFTIASFTSAG